MGIYYTDAMDVLRAAGLTVRENGTTNGWQSRARFSGGFPNTPVCVFWHHTASSTSPESDLIYMIENCPDEPVGNMLIDRDGAVWPIAAGASNCAPRSPDATFGSSPSRNWATPTSNGWRNSTAQKSGPCSRRWPSIPRIPFPNC